MLSDEGDEQDLVFQRVHARMHLEPIQLVMAYCEHAYRSPAAELPSDHLERSLEASFDPMSKDQPQPSADPQSTHQLQPPRVADVPSSSPEHYMPPPTLSQMDQAPQPVESCSASPPELLPPAHQLKSPHEKPEAKDPELMKEDRLDRTSPEPAGSFEIQSAASSAVPFQREDGSPVPRDGGDEDASSILERVRNMGMQIGDDSSESGPQKGNKWSREHTLDTCCKWESRLVAESIIYDLTTDEDQNTL
jgi:hypothetical protein